MSRFPSPRLHGALALTLAVALAGCAGDGATRADAPTGPQVVGTVDAGPAIDPAGAVVPPVQMADDDAYVDAAGDPQALPLEDPAPATGGATAPAPLADGRTQAEQDYDALYGGAYNPVADPTLPAPAQMPASYDPWEPFNRRVHAFNNVVDRVVAKPLAQAYVAVVPRPVRLGVGNFFNNLGQPVSALNALLQGKPVQAGQSLGRFLVNSTLGVAGLFDPATSMRIPMRSEDFGQTLGIWGWRNSRYVELPLFGPRTVRDTFGLVGDAPLSPIRQVDDDATRIFLQGLQLVDTRVQLMPLDSLREGATDEYALFRDGWTQRRNYQIFGAANQDQEGDALPDYLLEDEYNPTVPADAMPLIPGSP